MNKKIRRIFSDGFHFLTRGWSWRESNPRPNEETIRFLHAYLCLGFSSAGKTRATNLHLIP